MNELVSTLVACVTVLAVIAGLFFGGTYAWSTLRVMNAESIGKAELARA